MFCSTSSDLSINLSKMPVLVDSGIAAVVARELIECSLFVVSHVGAVIKNTSNSDKEKHDCIRKVFTSIELSRYS